MDSLFSSIGTAWHAITGTVLGLLNKIPFVNQWCSVQLANDSVNTINNIADENHHKAKQSLAHAAAPAGGVAAGAIATIATANAICLPEAGVVGLGTAVTGVGAPAAPFTFLGSYGTCLLAVGATVGTATGLATNYTLKKADVEHTSIVQNLSDWASGIFISTKHEVVALANDVTGLFSPSPTPAPVRLASQQFIRPLA